MDSRDQQAYVSQIPEKISDPKKLIFMHKIHSQKNQLLIICKANNFKFSKSKKNIGLVCTKNHQLSV